ncbi:hypothetical protein DH2020_010718 [Rehmannia glutinosa]|uniref:Seipin n=1 Tax=Rehmannia glutinosa TaxID=99300 RepID=A0ABR0XBG3_REHGL
MESDEVDENYNKNLPIFPNPFIFCTNLLSLQSQIISTCIVSLASPFLSVISLVFNFFRRPQPIKEQDSESEPISTVARGGSLLLGRIAVGLLAAAYVCMVLMIVMVVAAVLGVGLVRAWAEEPVYVRESLQFDYADAHPTALFLLGTGEKLTAELVSLEGDRIAKSNHPCMLQFRSWPIRLTRTFLMGIPLLLGITAETQTITFPILKHKETSYPRTEYIRITLIPRAGTASLPQFYDAEVIVQSRPPWTKELVYRWKWTFYVWTTLYIFIVLVMVLVCFLKPLIFPVMATPFAKYEQDSAVELESPEPLARPREEREVSESLRRWQRSRSKRKAALLHGAMSEDARSPATSISVAHEGESGESFEEGSGDSESVCFRGCE